MGKIDDIEQRKDIAIVRDQFLSEEWVDKINLPKFWADGGDGKHIVIVRYNHKFYVTRKTTKVVEGPIDVLVSGRT